MAKELNEHQARVMNFYAAVLTASRNLNEADRRELALWESRYTSALGTSSWPRWKEFIPDFIYIDFSELTHTPAKNNKAVIPHCLRWQVWERDNFTCGHCGSRKNLSIDHVQPESKGGTLELDNLQTLCKPCNSRKGAR